METKGWLPTSAKEVKELGWDQCDIILITGDAYIDHPSFGIPVIGRILESKGYKVAIIPQPNWQDDLRDFRKLGTPRLFFGVSAGAMDSMVNHYTAGKRKRSTDAYTPGNKSGFRPDYPTIVYTQILKKLFPETPVIIGGIEASLRRVTHYDYWQNKLRPSFLYESGADLLVYGMGEQPIIEIARLLEKGVPFSNLKTIPQTAYLLETNEELPKNKLWIDQELFSYEDCLKDKIKYAKNFVIIETESNTISVKRLIQKNGNKKVIINPGYPTPEPEKLDQFFDLPFTRLPHPKYRSKDPIPAYEMIRHSVNIHRGCFGGCSFCTISAHQGKFVVSRTEKSILKELEAVTQMPDFKGHISDIGGPSANMYMMKGRDLKICEHCRRPSCIHPSICNNLETSHQPMIDLYRKARQIKGIKKVTIGSGLRYDLFLDPNGGKNKKNHEIYFEELVKHHISGRLKVAPEHTENEVLRNMRKPSFSLFEDFKKKFDDLNHKNDLEQQLIPYFISSHPESKPEDMANLAIKTKNMGFRLEQVQDFTPTPMTLATVMYYSGFDPYTKKDIFVAKSPGDKEDQRAFFFWYKKEHHQKIRSILTKNKLNHLILKLLNK